MKILFVCAGNICRSVIAECVARSRSRELLGKGYSVLEVESSGIKAENNLAPHPECLQALELLGINDCDTTSTLADKRHVLGSDLVITMTRQQCYILASKFPEYESKCFSLIEINGAIETLLERQGELLNQNVVRCSDLSEKEAARAFEHAAAVLTSVSRESMRPIAGVPITIHELMTRFSPCFYQVSGIHDPLGGATEEIEKCAFQIETEVTSLLNGLLTLGTGLSGK